MKYIYDLIQENPGFFAWIFGIVNVLWGVFLYFNSKRHDRELKALQHSLDLDLERRKQVFELKVSQYERYVGMLDEFGRKYQTELITRMKPMFEQYMSAMLAANGEHSKNAAIATFSTQVMELMNESSAEYMKLKAESRSLKLTASDSLIKIFEELETLVQASMNSAHDLIKQLPVLIMSNDEHEMSRLQNALNEQGECIQVKSSELERQMRFELKEI